MSKQEAELKGVEDYAVECSLIKVGASEDLQNCSDEGIQIFGGMGFSADTPMESAWRDARIGRIYEGTNEINRMLSVGMLLKKGMKGQIDLMGSVMKAANAFGQDTSNQIISDNHLSQEISIISKFKNLFLILLGNVVQKFGNELEKQQQILLSLSDILIEIYFSESALYRTLKNIDNQGIDSQTTQENMVQFYVFEAYNIIHKSAREIILSISDGKEQEQLLKILNESGFELREPGCSACLAMNDDKVPAGKYAVSTSNRNFEGRQGPGSRTLLASPLVAAAAAITGKITDPRTLY